MEAYRINNDPKVIAGHFLDAVKSKGGCPMRVHANRCAENGHVQQIQNYLRRNYTDEHCGSASFIYGTSTSNQQIEWWWGLLRKENLQFWINLFEALKEEGQVVNPLLCITVPKVQSFFYLFYPIVRPYYVIL